MSEAPDSKTGALVGVGVAAALIGTLAVAVVTDKGTSVAVDERSDGSFVALTEPARADCAAFLFTGGDPPGNPQSAAVAALNGVEWHAMSRPGGLCAVEVRGRGRGAAVAKELADKAEAAGTVRDASRGKAPSYARDANGCRTHVWLGEDPCADVDAGVSDSDAGSSP